MTLEPNCKVLSQQVANDDPIPRPTLHFLKEHASEPS